MRDRSYSCAVLCRDRWPLLHELLQQMHASMVPSQINWITPTSIRHVGRKDTFGGGIMQEYFTSVRGLE